METKYLKQSYVFFGNYYRYLSLYFFIYIFQVEEEEELFAELENDGEFNIHERQIENRLASRQNFEDEIDNSACREGLRGTEY